MKNKNEFDQTRDESKKLFFSDNGVLKTINIVGKTGQLIVISTMLSMTLVGPIAAGNVNSRDDHSNDQITSCQPLAPEWISGANSCEADYCVSNYVYCLYYHNTCIFGHECVYINGECILDFSNCPNIYCEQGYNDPEA